MNEQEPQQLEAWENLHTPKVRIVSVMTKPDNKGPQAQRQNSRRRRNKNDSKSTPDGDESEGTQSQPTSQPQTPVKGPTSEPAEGVSFEQWVKSSLVALTTNSTIMLNTLLGEKDNKGSGVVTRLKTVEGDLYGPPDKPQVKGLKQRVADLETKVRTTSSRFCCTPSGF